MTEPMQPDHAIDEPSSPARLAALRSYGVLDTPREADFDELVGLAAKICGTPISVVNLIEEDRQWFKAEVGLGIRETPLDVSICRHVLLQPGITVIPDLLADPRMCLNPLVTADAGLRFYAGCLLKTPEGHGIGTLCVLDHKPRGLSEDQLSALAVLANQVMGQMELRRTISQKTRLVEQQQVLLAQQDLLLKEVHHRTKNNLQLIIGLIELQLRKMEGQEARTALADISRRIMSIAAVHEKLYQTDLIDMVDAGVYLRSVVEGITATSPAHVSLALDIASVLLPMDLAIPLALIVNELVTNALKYAYDENASGPITVSLAPVDGLWRLSVTDSGKGLPADFVPQRSRSLGMKIIASLTRQLKGELEFIDNRPGLACRLTFSAGHGASL
ncbi:MAG TPA: histidine kinase dimerization/phosphoacceptor domain -containing protein [Pseudomonas sp.]|uniref:histidine kinase dimerization/phosphoacceptor domain -containing protein n=1 Tax=Pseudomonas sp. TaxID=306 RepID=UPI002B48FB6E|nr:histidine kinase dimerization/phosphoacceptor domain -containing protein [Pseudomonas sp.]HKS15654.1 histidine kinase dimerization/phosphoacceptor domain -containing protein [Pseudomonas sp.]